MVPISYSVLLLFLVVVVVVLASAMVACLFFCNIEYDHKYILSSGKKVPRDDVFSKDQKPFVRQVLSLLVIKYGF